MRERWGAAHRPGDLDTREGWAIIQHLTVAQLRASLALPGASPEIATDLGPAYKDAPFQIREESAG